jgi:hypothetical protein
MSTLQTYDRFPLLKLIEKIAIGVCLILLALQTLRYANPAFDELGSDGSIYFYVGSLITHGKLPYADAMETKPPVIFYLNALGYLLGGGTRWGLWLMEFVFISGALVFGYLLIKKIFGPVPALIGSLFWALGLPDLLLQGNFTEEFSLLPNFMALYIFWRFKNQPKKIYFGLIGFLFAFSFLLRPNNALVPILLVAIIVLVDLFQRKGNDALTKTGWFLFGFIISFAIVYVYFLYKGIASDYIEAAYLYNFSNSNPVQRPSLWDSSLVPGFSKLGISAWIAVAGYLVNIYYLVIRRHTILNLYLLFLWPFEIVLSGLTGRGYGHYFIIWLPAIALLIGMFIHFLEQTMSKTFLGNRLRGSLSRAVFSALFALVLFFSFSGIVQKYGESFYRILFDRVNGIEYVDPVSAYVRSSTQPGDQILVWGGHVKINIMSRREAPTAYVYYPLFISSPYSERYESRFFRDLETKRPILIIDAYPYNVRRDILSLDPEVRRIQIEDGKGWEHTPHNLDEVLNFIANNYHLEKMIKTHFGRVAVYRINQ